MAHTLSCSALWWSDAVPDVRKIYAHVTHLIRNSQIGKSVLLKIYLFVLELTKRICLFGIMHATCFDFLADYVKQNQPCRVQ